ncbi:polysaccharide deacetylase family protein [Sinanaerobacter chloroacetimidivorans]|jgi:peptidoglycan/xylan/chitin deacetylase (PgdA/CDA1 family)|uniref:Polysaccharide deacetylase family protein n=1 Tax=Sinanaerobacter chloroacetimidivorans TaxID=2818044 RepID=A0A8J7VX95_9FIRM|nr:polysaccharide deacetylase family protein [Sinanaerobacter chloroacetimidivorans]MBR0596744.1 polysaccharide deacetylase family protein [Sinanaerobacter chloroacetimidivorans]
MKKKKIIIYGAIIFFLIFSFYQIFSIHSLIFDKEVYTVSDLILGVEGKGIDQENIIIRKGAEDSKKLTLSCNVDWGEEVLPDMLKILRDNNVKITFFVSGRWAENNPELLKAIAVDGHEIQNHGYGHKLCTQISVDKAKEEILKTEAVILNITGVKTTVFAPPSGDYDDTTVDLCKSLGYKMALWSADTIDWREGSTASVIKERILKKPLKGAIVLMHPKSETVKALPELIQEIKAQNIEIVPLYSLPL